MRLHYDCFLLLNQQRVSHRAVVIEDGANKNIGISRLHYLTTEAGADSTPICPNKMWMVLWHQPFTRWHNCYWISSGICKLYKGLLCLSNPYIWPPNKDRLHSFIQKISSRFHGCF